MPHTSMKPKEKGFKKIKIRKLKFSAIRILKDGKEVKSFQVGHEQVNDFNHHYASPERRYMVKPRK